MLSPGLHVCLCGLLTFGVPLALAVRELILMRRGNWRPPPGPKPVTPPDLSGPGTRALPACLNPPLPARRRTPELV